MDAATLHQIVTLALAAAAEAPQAAPSLPRWVDLAAVLIGSITGAATAVRRGFDIAGVLVLSIVMGFGGGIVRDILLQDGPPAAMADSTYLLLALAAAAVGFFFASVVDRISPMVQALDALSLGVFAAVGFLKGLDSDLPVVSIILLGVVTAVGGGIIRDVLCGEVPDVFRPGHLNMSAVLVGLLALQGCEWLGVSRTISIWSCVVLIFALRMGSIRMGWKAPVPLDLGVRMRRR
jgi:uncharacterized membrane protein YeiH